MTLKGQTQTIHIKEIYEQALQLYKSTNSTRLVAEKLCISKNTVDSWIYKNHSPCSVSSKWKNRNCRVPHHSQRMKLAIHHQQLTPEKAYIFGVLCGDASVGKRVVRLGVVDADFASTFAHAITTVYGIKPTISYVARSLRYSRRGKFYIHDRQIHINVNSTLVVEDITRYGNFGTYVWRVPVEILYANDDIQGAFLQGFFDSEGSFSGGMLRASSINLQGAQQIQYMLTNLGIRTALNAEDKQFIIYISGQKQFRTFAEKIGFSIKRKQERLLNYINSVDHRREYTINQYNRVIKLRKDGYKTGEISNLTNIPDFMITRWIHGHNKPRILSDSRVDISWEAR